MDIKTWERRTELPLIGASVVFLAAYAYVVLAQPVGGFDLGAQAVVWAAWGIFAVDYVVRLVLAEERGRWFVRHLLDLAVVALPILRPLRILRLLALLKVIQRLGGTALRGRVVIYVSSTTVLILFVSALAMLDTERHAVGATITSFGDAIWWAFVTMTTVGYGDYTPVTATGRAIAVVMMIAGIALLGTVTATLASWFVERIAAKDEESEAATKAQVASLTAEIAALRAELRQGHVAPPAG